MSVDFSRMIGILGKIEENSIFLKLLCLLGKFSLSTKVKKLTKLIQTTFDIDEELMKHIEIDEKILARIIYQTTQELIKNKRFKGFGNAMRAYLDRFFRVNSIDDVWKISEVTNDDISKVVKLLPFVEQDIMK